MAVGQANILPRFPFPPVVHVLWSLSAVILSSLDLTLD